MNQELLPQMNLSHYHLVAKIGAGGMGEVYRARDTRLDREVAIKMLPADFANDADRLRRFEPMLQWYESVFGAKVRTRRHAVLVHSSRHFGIALLRRGV